MSGYRIIEAVTSKGTRPYLVNDRLDFVGWHREYIDYLCQEGRSQNTLRNKAYALKHLADFLHEEGLGLGDLDSDRLFDFRNWLSNPFRSGPQNVSALPGTSVQNGKRLEPSSVDEYISCISSYLRFAVKKGLLKVDPTPYFRKQILHGVSTLESKKRFSTHKINGLRQNKRNGRPKTITKAIFRKMLNATVGNRDKALLCLLYEGGFRSGEVLGMRVEDISFEDCGIWVRRRLDNPNGALAKGEDRFVELPLEVMALVELYLSEEWLSAGPKHEMLWINSKTPKRESLGNPLSSLSAIFLTLSQVVEVHVHPHMLRHSHVTNLARGYRERGEPIDWKFISSRVGHSSVTVTMQTYAHLGPEDHKPEYRRVTRTGSNSSAVETD